jgi:hypothetical protein
MTLSRRLLLPASLVLLTCVQQASAQLSITWSTIDGGGGTSTGGVFSLSGTIGQHDAGPAMAGGTFTLTGGFWAGTGSAHPSFCCLNDYNGDGDLGTDADIEAFFACLGGNCCPTCPPDADFNCDGDIGTDGDIEAFFRILGGGDC